VLLSSCLVLVIGGVGVLPAFPEDHATFEHVYVVQSDGHIFELDSKFDVVASRRFPGYSRPRNIITAALSPDGKYILLGAAFNPLRCVSTETLTEADFKLPTMPAPHERLGRAIPCVIWPSQRYAYMINTAYNFGGGNAYGLASSTLLLDFENSVAKPLPGLRLVSQDRVRISPDGRVMLLAYDPIKVVDVPTGNTIATFGTNEVNGDPRTTGEVALHGLDVDWPSMTIDMWQTHVNQARELELRRVCVDLGKGDETACTDAPPWPEIVFDRTPGNRALRALRKGLLNWFSGRDCEIAGFSSNTVLRSPEASAFARLKDEWLAQIDYEGSYCPTFLSPSGKYLLWTELRLEDHDAGRLENDPHRYTAVCVMDTFTGDMVKTIHLEEQEDGSSVAEILFF